MSGGSGHFCNLRVKSNLPRSCLTTRGLRKGLPGVLKVKTRDCKTGDLNRGLSNAMSRMETCGVALKVHDVLIQAEYPWGLFLDYPRGW